MRFRDGESSAIKHEPKSVHVYTDGHRMRKCALPSHKPSGVAHGAKISANTERPFTFANIRTTGVDHALVPNHSTLFTLRPWIIQMKTQYLAAPIQSPMR